MGNKKELDAVTASDPLSRYRYFLNVVFDTAAVWMFRSTEGAVLRTEAVNRLIVPIFARDFFGAGWARQPGGYLLESVPLDSFVDEHLSSNEFTGVALSVMPAEEDWGYIVDIGRFIRDVRMELDLIT